MKRAGGIEELAMDLQAAGIPFVREFQFCPPRKWRADFKIAEHDILIEVEGGTWSGGRHTSGVGYRNDCEKYSEAAILGYTVIRVTADMVRDGKAFQLVEKALQLRGVPCPQCGARPVLDAPMASANREATPARKPNSRSRKATVGAR